MLKVLKDCSAFAYADDTAIIVSDKNIDIAYDSMQSQLNEITKWCHDNGLIINASKTKLMHIKPPHLNCNDKNIIFHNYNCLHNVNNTNYTDTCTTTIEIVKTYKYLGIYVDDNFKWLTHIKYLSRKLRQSAYSLYHLSNCSTFDVLKQAYFSLVESYIRHGITAWGNATYCRSLQQTQNRILKILLKNKHHNRQQPQIENINININNNTYTNNINFFNNTYNNNTFTNNNTYTRNNTYTSNNTFSNNNTYTNNSIYTNNNTYTINNTYANNIMNSFNNINFIGNINNINTYTNTNIISSNTTNTYTTNAQNILHTTNLNSNMNIHNTQQTFYNATTNTTGSININPQRSNKRNKNNNIATYLEILNIKSIYSNTLVNEFYNDTRYLKPINHVHNTRQRAEGRYQVERHKNNYGKNTLKTTIPNILNNLPVQLLNISNHYKRKTFLKEYFIRIQ